MASNAQIEADYKKAARKGTAIPAGEREGKNLGGERFSGIKEYEESRAMNRGMAEGLKKASDRKDAASLAKSDSTSIGALKKAGAERLTVGRGQNNEGRQMKARGE